MAEHPATYTQTFRQHRHLQVLILVFFGLIPAKLHTKKGERSKLNLTEKRPINSYISTEN